MTGAVLVGGRSQRMAGGDKTLMFREGQRVLVRTLGLLEKICNKVILVARGPVQAQSFSDLKIAETVCDLFPENGPLGGLNTALENAVTSVLLLACDMPFIELALLQKLVAVFESKRPWAVVPRSPALASQGDEHWRVEPLCAIWSQHCKPLSLKSIENHNLSMTAFARQVQAEFVDLSAIEARQLRNINTPTDLTEGLEIHGVGQGNISW